ncbi:MAG: hypothetical protein SGI77_11925 [Pirellulaceae bacterium]|nr:hypothetical protein [Pirellulaceae bacterium]
MKFEENLPAYLPKPFMDETAYQTIYEHTNGADDWELDDEEEPIAISSLSAEEVYRMLPSASDFEYGGFITRNEIRYQACEAFSENTHECQPCTWHSHPTAHPNADMPSGRDILNFLKWRSRRAVTVGRDWIWVIDKSLSTIPIIEKLRSWEVKNMVPRMIYWLGTDRKINGYIAEALEVLGLPPIKSNSEWKENWPDLVGALGLEVTKIHVKKSQG